MTAPSHHRARSLGLPKRRSRVSLSSLNSLSPPPTRPVKHARRRVPFLPTYKLLIPVLVLLIPTTLILSSFSYYSLPIAHSRLEQVVVDPLGENQSLLSSVSLTKSERLALSPRETRLAYHGVRGGNTSSEYAINVVVVCKEGCCVSDLPHVIKPLLVQTLIPAQLTVLHGCADGSATENLRKEVRRGLGGESSYSMWPQFVDRSCGTGMTECLLAYLAMESEAEESGYVMVMDARTVLEVTALETMWLSLVSRKHVTCIRALAYVPESLHREKVTDDPLAVRTVVAGDEPVKPLPMMFSVAIYREAVTKGFRTGGGAWAPFIEILSEGRVIRKALYTDLGGEVETMSLKGVNRKKLPQHLFSEIASQRWAAQLDENEMYADRLNQWADREGPLLDLSPIEFPKVVGAETRIFLVLPWMQMGGSEKCMLDVAERVLEMGWGATFVLTMPFWQENEIGEIGLHHQWLDKALVLSSDTFDLLGLASHEKSIKLFRHLLTSREPDYLLLANTRWAYGNSAFIRKLSPRTVIADYNHMIHMSWEGGGMPRYGANNTESFDLHLTASKDVADAMRGWIKEDIIKESPDKVQPCYIGTDPSMLYTGHEKTRARARMRQSFNVSDAETVVLFAGRFVIDKGLDVMSDLINRVAEEEDLAEKLTFVFVGSGDEEHRIRSLLSSPTIRNGPKVFIRPPAKGLMELREYYALSDIFLLPSVNEGIALVVYEAMASGVLVIATDVGGQKEVITPETGILLPNFRSLSRMTSHTFSKLKEVVENPESFAKIASAGQEFVRNTHTTEKFRTCVVQNLLRVKDERDAGKRAILESSNASNGSNAERDIESFNSSNDTNVSNTDDIGVENAEYESSNSANGTEHESSVVPEVADEVIIDSEMEERLILGAQTERYHGVWNLNAAGRTVENLVTIGIKTYVCDPSTVVQVRSLLRSIRVHYPRIRVLLGNDGPMRLGIETFVRDDPHTEELTLPSDCGISFGRNYMVNVTTTRYFILLDDDHVFDDTTNLTVLTNGIRKDEFDMVGIRVRNLPGIDELERTGILIPRYVALIQKLEQRILTLCVWNENKGPSIFGITHPIPVDVLHNAFIGRTAILRKHPWRDVLKVNEHMTFFLDAKNAGLRVGYLPSVFIHHRSRDYSDCYYKIRFREDQYRKLLPYKDEFAWDMKCQAKFPDKIRSHILKYELDM